MIGRFRRQRAQQQGFDVRQPQPVIDRMMEFAKARGVPAAIIGTTGGETLAIKGHGEISLSELGAAHEGWFPGYMAGEEIPPTN